MIKFPIGEKFATMKHLVLAFLVPLLLFPFSGISQKAQKGEPGDIRPGEIMVQIPHDRSIEGLVNELREWKGKATDLEVERKLSRIMRFWLLSFDHEKVDQKAFLDAIKGHPSTSLAQFNHYIKQRATPNDPKFTDPDQWQYVNDGSSGGTPDADIDAEKAWDITKGGRTIEGDTIVAAVIDGGADVDHEDLNIFINQAEANGQQGVDDDGNGYVDDINGWDAQNNDGSVGSSQHGTHVSGTVAAEGDNNKGLLGVNWNAQVLNIQGSSQDESVVVDAYDYALEMRALYDSTDGEKGAFVVSTNSSFGVNGGDPANYPLWCAAYDSLGKYGITSAVAGPNQDVNIDQEGDVPGTCPSDHTLSITNTDHNDDRGTAGWGPEHTDMGAPGTNIISTVPNDQYDQLTGTSMATPHVCGAIALMYSASCPQLIQLAKNDPDSASRLVKSFLMKGVDEIQSMKGSTKSDGRLNIHKALLVMDSLGVCDTSACPAPYQLEAGPVTDKEAWISWEGPDSAKDYNIHYRKTGANSWTDTSTSADSLLLPSLEACTDYELEVETVCDTMTSGYSNTLKFQTKGCCEPPSNLSVDTVQKTSAVLNWDTLIAAKSYDLEYRPRGGNWQMKSGISQVPYELSGLDSCTNYVFRVQTVCDTGTTSFTDTLGFKTFGCGPCLDFSYCESRCVEANEEEEWIDTLAVRTLLDADTSTEGYVDATHKSTELATDSTYGIAITPAFQGDSFEEYFKVWIDYDMDGTFNDSNELAFDPGQSSTNKVSGSITVPGSASRGLTRMRVTMKWVGDNNNPPPKPCEEEFDYGQVKDYCVTIVDSTTVGFDEPTSDEPSFKLYPNPARDRVTIRSRGAPEKGKLQIMDPTGRTVRQKEIRGSVTHMGIPDLANGIYFYQVLSESDRILKRGKIVVE